MTEDAKTTEDPWRETVRDLFDLLITKRDALSHSERRMLDVIEKRHHDYFCEGKTLAEWDEESRNAKSE